MYADKHHIHEYRIFYIEIIAWDEDLCILWLTAVSDPRRDNRSHVDPSLTSFVVLCPPYQLIYRALDTDTDSRAIFVDMFIPIPICFHLSSLILFPDILCHGVSDSRSITMLYDGVIAYCKNV